MLKTYGYLVNLTLWIYNFSPMPLENEGNPEGLQLLRESLRKVQLESPDKVRGQDRQLDIQQTDGQTCSRLDTNRQIESETPDKLKGPYRQIDIQQRDRQTCSR